jgi:hypothetical protein
MIAIVCVLALGLSAINAHAGPAGTGDRNPVPDGGTTLILLGGALVGLGALRRKFGA